MDQDFSSFPSDQLDEVARITVLIAKRLARRLSRRRRPVKRGGVVDLRRSIRANMMKGEIIELRRRERRRKLFAGGPGISFNYFDDARVELTAEHRHRLARFCEHVCDAIQRSVGTGDNGKPIPRSRVCSYRRPSYSSLPKY